MKDTDRKMELLHSTRLKYSLRNKIFEFSFVFVIDCNDVFFCFIAAVGFLISLFLFRQFKYESFSTPEPPLGHYHTGQGL